MATMVKAQSTYGTYLMTYSKDTDAETYSYKKLIDIIDYSDLGSTPNMIAVTTLSDDAETSIAGIKQMGDGMTFTFNIRKDEFLSLKELEYSRDVYEFALVFSNKKFDSIDKTLKNEFCAYFLGTVSVAINGGGVDEALQGTLTIAPQLVEQVQDEVITFTQPTTHLNELTAQTFSFGR